MTIHVWLTSCVIITYTHSTHRPRKVSQWHQLRCKKGLWRLCWKQFLETWQMILSHWCCTLSELRSLHVDCLVHAYLVQLWLDVMLKKLFRAWGLDPIKPAKANTGVIYWLCNPVVCILGLQLVCILEAHAGSYITIRDVTWLHLSISAIHGWNWKQVDARSKYAIWHVGKHSSGRKNMCFPSND